MVDSEADRSSIPLVLYIGQVGGIQHGMPLAKPARRHATYIWPTHVFRRAGRALDVAVEQTIFETCEQGRCQAVLCKE